jgi:hypothetical protein
MSTKSKKKRAKIERFDLIAKEKGPEMSKELIITEEDAAIFIKKDGTIEIYLGKKLDQHTEKIIDKIVRAVNRPQPHILPTSRLNRFMPENKNITLH